MPAASPPLYFLMLCSLFRQIPELRCKHNDGNDQDSQVCQSRGEKYAADTQPAELRHQNDQRNKQYNLPQQHKHAGLGCLTQRLHQCDSHQHKSQEDIGTEQNTEVRYAHAHDSALFDKPGQHRLSAKLNSGIYLPLNKALLGESARLLGGFIIGMTWTLALSRASIPPERRHIVSVYIDEVQDYLNLPGDISDALAQARGLGVGMTLAHQYRDQLSPEIRAGVDDNCLNKIIFGLNSKDAKDIAAMAPELTAEDFMMLPRYQIYTSFQSSGRSTSWVMGRALPPTPALRDPVELRAQSMENYGVPAKEVGDEYLKMFRNGSFSGTDPDTPIGRRRKS